MRVEESTQSRRYQMPKGIETVSVGCANDPRGHRPRILWGWGWLQSPWAPQAFRGKAKEGSIFSQQAAE